MKPYTFSNGITVPSGTVLYSPQWPIHKDERIYENANEFRFSKMRERHGEHSKFGASNTSKEFLSFGHGQNAW